jgi:hypothetical protein
MKDTLNFAGLGLLAISASLGAWGIYRTPPNTQPRLTELIAAGLIGVAFFCQLIALVL